MLKNSLLEKINAGKVALGMRINDPEMVELCAHLGFDWFMLDQMFTEFRRLGREDRQDGAGHVHHSAAGERRGAG